MISRVGIFFIIIFMIAGCEAAANNPTPSPSPTVTQTELPTETLAPSATASPTPSPTITASPSPIPTETQIPTETATATATPPPAVPFVFDNWERVELPASIKSGIDQPYLLFSNSNDKQTIQNLSTPKPNTNREVIYIAPGSNPFQRIPLLELESEAPSLVFPSKNGKGIAYFHESGLNSGLYLLDMTNGLSARIINLPSLAQRGFFSEPSWHPSGDHFVISLDAGYALDLYIYERDGSGRKNITESGAYEFWPAYSPDGKWLAFVSDSATCPTWQPDSGGCDPLIDTPPAGGEVYVMNMDTGELSSISDDRVYEKPYWIDDHTLVYIVFDPANLLNPSREIWLKDMNSGELKQIQIEGEAASGLYLSESFSSDASQLVLQRATESGSEVVLMTTDNEVIRIRDDISFPRYGMSATWNPDNSRFALGGLNGQCPYGIRVYDADFNAVATGNPPPSMCQPIYSANGAYIAFSGINPKIDGRLDIYVTNFNGFAAQNITADLDGLTHLVGWLNPDS